MPPNVKQNKCYHVDSYQYIVSVTIKLHQYLENNFMHSTMYQLTMIYDRGREIK